MIEDCQLKIERARSHIAELQGLIAAHDAQYPPVVDARYDEDGSLVHIGVAVVSLPRLSSAIIGDVIHNLRAALDVLAVGLVECVGGNPKGVYFPFATDEAHLEEMIKKKNFYRAGEAAVEELRRLRPYSGGNDLLRGLHDLDIQDKHHAIIPVAAMMTTPQVAPAHVDFDAGVVKLKLVEGGKPDVRYVFPEGSAFQNSEVIPKLYDSLDLVGGIVSGFERAVNGGRRAF